MTLVHSLDETLERFQLIAGSGSETDGTACAMTALAWMRGEAWTDQMSCAHPLIRQNVIKANDLTDTTPEMRAELVRAGVDGVIDTWWVPAPVIVWALAQAPRDASMYERVVRAVREIGGWKATKPQVDLAGAYLADANLAGAYLAGAYLADAYLTDANLAGANLTGADLTDADLTGANLTGANLTGANLTGANLTDAYRPTDPPDGWQPNEAGLLVRKTS